MQQRAGRRDPQPVAEPGCDRLDPVEHRIEVGPPDVAAVDHAQRQHLVRRQQIEHRHDIAPPVDRIDVQPGHRQIGGQIRVLQQLPEIGGQQQLDPAALQMVIGRREGMLPVRIQVGDQDRLIDLHPLNALRGQRVQQLCIDRQQPFEQRQLVRTVLGLADGQIGDRPDDHRLGLALLLCPRLGELIQQARRIELEAGLRGELRDDVVVVGVEPLGHLAGGDPAAAGAVLFGRLRRTAARDAEVVVQHIAMEAAHAIGQIAQREAHVQHLVVEREVADRHQIQRRLLPPVPLAKLRPQGQQRFARRRPLPVRLQGELQLASGADSRETQIVRADHRLPSIQRDCERRS